ncbi:MAG: hypothetical protein U1F10_14425 [Burkholderiales bacterium]
MAPYRHTQVGWRMLAGTAVGMALATLLVANLSPATRAAVPWLVAGMYGVLALGCLLFPTLTVTVDDEELRLSFGLGIVRTAVPLADIAGVDRVRVRVWWGWGLHWTPGGWLYNIGGRDAVKVAVRRGRGVLVGSDDADRLFDALAARVAATRTS